MQKLIRKIVFLGPQALKRVQKISGKTCPRAAPPPRPLALPGPPCPRRVHIAVPLAVALVLLAPVAGRAADLFTPVAESPPSSLPSADLTLRSRTVTMDLEQVRRAQAAVAAPPGPIVQTKDVSARTDKSSAVPPPGTTLTFNLFDDVVVTGRVERTAPTFSGGYSVAGHLVEEPLGTMTLVVNGETVAGTVRTLGETYHIRSVGDGLYAISEVEEPPLNCEVDESHSEAGHQH